MERTGHDRYKEKAKFAGNAMSRDTTGKNFGEKQEEKRKTPTYVSKKFNVPTSSLLKILM